MPAVCHCICNVRFNDVTSLLRHIYVAINAEIDVFAFLNTNLWNKR